MESGDEYVYQRIDYCLKLYVDDEAGLSAEQMLGLRERFLVCCEASKHLGFFDRSRMALLPGTRVEATHLDTARAMWTMKG